MPLDSSGARPDEDARMVAVLMDPAHSLRQGVGSTTRSPRGRHLEATRVVAELAGERIACWHLGADADYWFTASTEVMREVRSAWEATGALPDHPRLVSVAAIWPPAETQDPDEAEPEDGGDHGVRFDVNDFPEVVHAVSAIAALDLDSPHGRAAAERFVNGGSVDDLAREAGLETPVLGDAPRAPAPDEMPEHLVRAVRAARDAAFPGVSRDDLDGSLVVLAHTQAPETLRTATVYELTLVPFGAEELARRSYVTELSGITAARFEDEGVAARAAHDWVAHTIYPTTGAAPPRHR
jgi:hypothetical protein